MIAGEGAGAPQKHKIANSAQCGAGALAGDLRENTLRPRDERV